MDQDKYSLEDRVVWFVNELRHILTVRAAPEFLQLDKQWLINEFGSLTAALEFFHRVLVELSIDLKLKFTIDTSVDTNRFDIRWEKMQCTV